MSGKQRSRRSFAPEPDSEVSPQENDTDIPQEHCLEPMDIDKEEKDFKKRVRAKFKEYHAGLKNLKKDQERVWKTLLVNKEGRDYNEYLEPEDREFLEKVHNAIVPYRENIIKIKEQKEMLKSIEHFHKILQHNYKLLEDLKQLELNTIVKNDFQLPL